MEDQKKIIDKVQFIPEDFIKQYEVIKKLE